MDEFTADAFANRDEPLRTFATAHSDHEASSSEADLGRRSHKAKQLLAPAVLKTTGKDPAAAEMDQATPAKPSLQDRLFAKVLQQVLPADDVDDDDQMTAVHPAESRSSKTASRPAFSLPIMTNNFRRFNARIGIVFVFQNRMIRLLTWRTPTHTLSFLATFTFVCLDPSLLVVLPLAAALLFVMVPAFTSRHPPPPPQTTVSSTTPYSYQQAYTGPALAPARTIKPASETSKDFFRNMRDLQNSMADFTNLHDTLVANLSPATNFSDETFSSRLFLYLTIFTTLSFITAHLLPWRFLCLVAGWAFVVSGHPTVESWMAKRHNDAEMQTLPGLGDSGLEQVTLLRGVSLPATARDIQSSIASLSAITLTTTPETCEVEIFELQYRPLQALSSASTSSNAVEWQPHLFTPAPYDPLSPARIAGDRPRGTRFLEDVLPPEGWGWAGKKWELDLEAGEWVDERLVVGVEYDVLHHDTEDQGNEPSSDNDTTGMSQGPPAHRRGSVNLDFGGWVWDLPPRPGSGVNREDDLWLAYGDYDIGTTGSGRSREEDKKRKKKREKGQNLSQDWEEASRVGNKGRTGEWRRRRWVRLVKRTMISVDPQNQSKHQHTCSAQ